MATNKETTPPKDVQAILVVKGAGGAEQDDTLSSFLRGFLPALTHLGHKVTVHERADIYKPPHISEHEDDVHKHVTEIIADKNGKKRRIWVKEIFWEGALKPPNALSSLAREWQMATYALGRAIHEKITGFSTGKERKKFVWFYISFFLMYFFVLLFPAFVLVFIPAPQKFTPAGEIYYSWPTLGILVGLYAIFIGFVATNPTLLVMEWLKTPLSKRPRLPGTEYWVLPVLVISILYYPSLYILWFLIIAVIELVLLSSRARVWSKRALWYSDTSTDDYWRYPKKKGVIHRQKPIISSLLYRFILVLVLPIGGVVLAISQLLVWTKILEPVGKLLVKLIALAMSDFMGDIVVYAQDPDQAQRIRSVVIDQIKHFDQHDEVADIHIFSHSLGTVITYETLFYHLPKDYRGNIRTYVTIGSVLRGMNKGNPVLDERFVPRFPVRFPSNASPGFKVNKSNENVFKWFNCWNLLDPATEFSSLDKYIFVSNAPKLTHPQNSGKKLPKVPAPQKKNTHYRSYNPHNIKTKALDNHGGYWTNLEDVQIPFAERVLGKASPDRWSEKKLEQEIKGNTPSNYHRWLTMERTLGFLIVSAVILYFPEIKGWLLQIFEWIMMQLSISVSITDLFDAIVKISKPETSAWIVYITGVVNTAICWITQNDVKFTIALVFTALGLYKPIRYLRNFLAL